MASLEPTQTPLLLSPLPSPGPQIISAEINIATRQVHTRLNKLITSRLPLALPPLAKTPELYAHGINNFGDVYLTFENCWQCLIAETSKLKLDKPTHDHQLRQWLCQLVPSGLWRSDAIKQDLMYLENVTDTNLEAVQNERLSAFTAQIYRRTREKPHVFVAYAWIMYMAIFSGGRWIREQLMNAGPEFWGVGAESEKMEYWVMGSFKPGFSLFCFSGPKDGENIKADFKKRLEGAESLLSEKERKDIVDEGQYIFEQCIGIVEGLDTQLKTNLDLVKVLSEREIKHGNKSRIRPKAGLSQAVENAIPGLLRAMVASLFAIAVFYSYKWQYGEEEE